MITKLYLENFRGIAKNEVELGKITVLVGPNNCGKSSIIYGLLVLKNAVLNSNQSLDSFLNLVFLNLGGFSQTVYLKDESSNILLGIDVSEDEISSHYSASLGKKESKLSLNTSKPFLVSLDLEVTFPYPANKTTGCEVKGDFGVAKITWNGITPTINIVKSELMDEKDIPKIIKDISSSLNAPIDELRTVDFIPLRRGFIKPNYSPVPMQQQLLTDEELATLLATDRDLEGKVAFYLEKIVDRTFNVRATIGTANFNLQSRDWSTGFVCDLVNEGFGTNQLVTILTKSLRKEMRTICIEESEIHLHPELIDKLVNVFIEIVKEEDKNFIISTHSEHVVLSLLNKVAQKKISPNDIIIYYLSKDRKKIKIEKQEVNEKGQIKGGLKGFYETELKEVKEFFNIPGEK
jgi:predicted ATPase